MGEKRVLIALTVGALCGLFCAYGTASMEDSGFPVTVGILASVFYNRLLMGLVIGLGESIRLHPVFRGAIIEQ
ncbi:MAG: hypothetical protein U9M95_05580 [Candidatus Altiarchaeota archaeon]|nr:hypothetical protein [Candidatus Altiarchaeota archaeon]